MDAAEPPREDQGAAASSSDAAGAAGDAPKPIVALVRPACALPSARQRVPLGVAARVTLSSLRRGGLARDTHRRSRHRAAQ
jgi:hypothetical protein